MSTAAPLYSGPGPSSQVYQYAHPAMQTHAISQSTMAPVQRPYAQPLQPQPGSSGNIYAMSQSLPAHLMPVVQPAPILQSSHTLPGFPGQTALYQSTPPTPISAVPTHASLPPASTSYPRPPAQLPMQQSNGGALPNVSGHQPPVGSMPYQHVSQAMYASTSAPGGFPAQPLVHTGMYSGMPSMGVGMGINQEYRFGGMPGQPIRMQEHEVWQGDWEDGDAYDQELLYGNVEVKQRRRTTPEQLKVLEHWFDINPKPDNALREWLAVELGMTKRNIQVWFQNRRAKVKGLALKEKQAAEKAAHDGGETGDPTAIPRLELAAPLQAPPPAIMSAISTASTSMLMPPTVPNVNMGRRVSLANGEAMGIEAWAAKRAAAGKAIRIGNLDGPARSPTIGAASAARRSSIPYPAPLTLPMDAVSAAAQQRALPLGALSPKASPSVRPMPSQLHLAAMRNNTRRASVPGLPGAGAAQLLSSGPFVPPRVVSSSHPIPPPATRTVALEPIKDHEHELATSDPNTPFDFVQTPYSASFLTSAGQVFPNVSPTTYAPPDAAPVFELGSSAVGLASGPLPNPTFSFGGPTTVAHHAAPQISDEEAARTQAFYMALQERGRMGSLASINTLTTEGATTEGESSSIEWFAPGDGSLSPSGLSQSRRASAPAELLQQIGFLGLTSASGLPMRPSPLGSNCINEEGSADAHYLTVSPVDMEGVKGVAGSCHTGGSSSMSSNSMSHLGFSRSDSRSTSNTTPELHSPIKLVPPTISSARDPSANPISSSASASSGATPVNGAAAWSSTSPFEQSSTHSDNGNPGGQPPPPAALPFSTSPSGVIDPGSIPVMDWAQFVGNSADGQDDFSFFNDLSADLAAVQSQGH